MKRRSRTPEIASSSAEARLIEAARGAPAALYQFRISPSGVGLSYVSPDFVVRYGLEQGDDPEETAARFFARMHPDDLDRMRGEIARSVKSLETFEMDFRFRGPAGEEFWIEARSNPVRTADGVLWNGIATDITARKSAELALRRRERQFQAIIDTLQDSYFRTDLEGRLVMMSPSTAAMFGYASIEALAGRQSRVLYADPAERDRVMAEIREKGFVRDYIAPGRRKDGGTLWASLNAQPWFDDEGHPAGIEGVARDITARMNAEAALRASEEQLRAIFDLASVGIAQADPLTGRWLSVNPRMCLITGYEADELLAKRVPEITHPDDRDRDWDLFQKVVKGEAPEYRIEKRYIRKDGSVAWVNVNMVVLRDAAGRPTRTVGVIADVTESKRAAEALAASENRYRVLFENAAEGIIAVDPETGGIQFFNPASCAMFGYTPEEFATLTLSDLHPKAALERILGEIRVLASGAPLVSPAMPCLRKDGTAFAADTRGSLIEVAGRKFVFGFFTDITARVHLEEKLRQSQKMEAVGQLAGGVAHDFNNLMTVISGNVDLLLSGMPVEDAKRGPLSDIRTASDRATSLTRQLLAFSRRQILEPKLVDVHSVVSGIEKMLRRLIGEDVDLLTELAASPSWVKVDPGQLEQVVMNLALNARDAMPRGGRITIRTRNVDPGDSIDPEETAGRQLRPKLAISISDTGSGIPPDAKAHLFEPFFTTKAFGKGTGLGLATVYGIVKQSGGDIAVESEPGKGSTFTVVLPSRPAPRRSGRSSASQRAVPRGTETVLVVEDEDPVRRIVKIGLESAGYRVIEARSGPEALAAAREHAEGIQLVITDVVMPEMSGRELAERLAADHPGVRILFMSGYTDDAVVRHGVVESGVAFLQKPFTPLALAQKVREVLDGDAPE